MSRLTFKANESKTYPVKLDDQYRAMLQDLMTWRQTDGAKVIRDLIAAAHRRERRTVRPKTPPNL